MHKAMRVFIIFVARVANAFLRYISKSVIFGTINRTKGILSKLKYLSYFFSIYFRTLMPWFLWLSANLQLTRYDGNQENKIFMRLLAVILIALLLRFTEYLLLSGLNPSLFISYLWCLIVTFPSNYVKKKSGTRFEIIRKWS